MRARRAQTLSWQDERPCRRLGPLHRSTALAPGTVVACGRHPATILLGRYCLLGLGRRRVAMKLLTMVEFHADFPNDQIEEDDEITRISGKGITEAIAFILTKNGMEVSAPEVDSEHGWEIRVVFKEREFSMLVTDLDDIKLIQIKELSSFIKRLMERNKTMLSFLDNVHSILSGDHRFSRLRWYSRDNYLKSNEGSLEPRA